MKKKLMLRDLTRIALGGEEEARRLLARTGKTATDEQVSDLAAWCREWACRSDYERRLHLEILGLPEILQQ
jgi:hypothetical protein